ALSVHEDAKKDSKSSKTGTECVSLWKLMASVVKSLDRDDSWWTANIGGGRDVFVGRTAVLSSYLVQSGFVESAADGVQSHVIGASGTDGDPLSVLIDLITTLLLVAGERDTRNGVASEKCAAFASALKESRLMGLPGVLYRLLCIENVSYDRSTPAELSSQLLHIVNQTLRLFNTLALVDKTLLEDCLKDEEMVVMLTHSFAVLLTWLCRMTDMDAMDLLLPRLLVAVGHFAAVSQRAQALTVLGGQHSIVQQLCVLPFRYFSDPALMRLLFPTLIACCFRRPTAVSLLKQELSPKLLSTFITEQSSSIEAQSTTVDAPAFANRFSKKLWPEAILFFESA
uniref:Uncharacterized protein n=1 Tax=Plectus sambesii TaxID=2011161 RepID=A0A914XVD8_9BILA